MKNPFENIYVGVIADNFPIFSFFIREKTGRRPLTNRQCIEQTDNWRGQEREEGEMVINSY